MDEPQDGTIVGWGNPVRGVRVRIDQFVDAEDDPRERWFPADDNTIESPITWSSLTKYAEAKGFEVYVLEVKK